MANNLQQQVDAYETAGLGTLQKMQQQNPKLLVGIALENLQNDMQADQRAKQMGGANVGPSVIDKKLAGLSGLGLGQQEALSTARPGLQQRGQQMQAMQLAKAMQQAQKRPAGGIASMPMMRNQMRRFDGGGGVEAEETQDTGFLATLRRVDEELKADEAARQAERMARGRRVSDYIPIPSYYLPAKNLIYDIGQGVSGLANLLKRRPAEETTPEPFDVEGRVIELLKARETADEEAKARIDQALSTFDSDTKVAARRRMSGLQAGGAVKKFSPGGEIVGIVDGVPVTRDQLTEEQLRILQQREELVASGTVVDPFTGVSISQAELQADRNQGLTNPEITEQVRRRNFPNRGEQFIDRTKQIIDVSPFNPVQSVREGFYEVTQDGSVGERFGRGLEKFGEGVVGSLVYGSAPTIAAGEQALGQAADVGRGFFTTGAVGESVEAAQEAIEERAELTRQRNTLTEQLRQINAQLQAPGLEAADIERLQNARNELSQQLENVNNRRTQLVDDSVVARGLDALPSFDDLRDLQEFIAGTSVGQRLLAENENRQEAREAEEIERRRAGELERLEAGLTPEQKATRALRQGRPQELFFPKTDEEEKSRAGLQPEKTPLSDRVLSFLESLGDFAGAPKGYEAATFVGRRRERAEQEAADKARADLLDREVEGRFNLMEEQERLRSQEAREIALAEYAGELTDLDIQGDAEFMRKAQELKEMYGPGFFGLGGDEAKLQAELVNLYNETRARKIREQAGYLGLDTTGQAGPVQDYSNYRPSTGQ